MQVFKSSFFSIFDFFDFFVFIIFEVWIEIIFFEKIFGVKI